MSSGLLRTVLFSVIPLILLIMIVVVTDSRASAITELLTDPQHKVARNVFNTARPGASMLPNSVIAPFNITVNTWEMQPSALYKPLPVAPGPDAVNTGLLYVHFSDTGIPTAIDHGRTSGSTFTANASLLTDIDFRLTYGPKEDSEAEQTLVHDAARSGYELRNSYFTRRLARFTDDAGADRLDVYTELVQGSMFTYVFPRVHLPPEQIARFSTSFTLAGQFSGVTYFDGNRRVQQSLTDIVHLTLDDAVTKPFLLFERPGGNSGVGLFMPVRPEVRAWYHEQYLTTDVPDVHVTLIPGEDGIVVSFVADDLAATSDRPHTFDFYYWLFPMTAKPQTALYAVSTELAPAIWSNAAVFNDPGTQGFWVQHWSNAYETRLFQMLRYYPAEGYSFARPEHFYQGIFATNQEDGHMWGLQTANYKRLNFSRGLPSAGMTADMGVRHLQLYLDKADETGVPPMLATAAMWFEFFDGLADYDLMHNFHFAQAPEFMVKTAHEFFDTGRPSPEDQWAITDVFNRMLPLLDPYNEQLVPITIVLPNGSYWYNYFEMETQRIRDGVATEPGFVNNVHITWLNIIVDAARLNKAVGNEQAYNDWRNLFRHGVAGLMYVFEQERAWDQGDPNELLYGINWGGPNAQYAQYILSGWLTKVMEFAYEDADSYMLADMVQVFRKIMRGKWAAQLEYASSRAAAVSWLNSYLHPRDTTPPVTTAVINGVDDADVGDLPATVMLLATDDLSGVQTIEYLLGDGVWQTYEQPIHVDATVPVQFSYRARDYAGNTESTQTVMLQNEQQ